MITADEAWEVAMLAAATMSLVEIECEDGKTFCGFLHHVEKNFLMIDGLGYPLDHIEKIYTV